jgi:hypothetical protein
MMGDHGFTVGELSSNKIRNVRLRTACVWGALLSCRPDMMGNHGFAVGTFVIRVRGV